MQRFLHQYWSRVKKAHWGVLHHSPIQHLLQNSSVPSLLSASLFTPLLLLCSHTLTFSLHLSSIPSINRSSVTVWKQLIHHGLEFGGNTTLSIWAFPSSPSLLFLHPIPPPSLHPPTCLHPQLLNAHWALCSREMHAGLIIHWTLFVSVMNGRAVCATTEVVKTKGSTCKRRWWHDKWPTVCANPTVQTGAQAADLEIKPIWNIECFTICIYSIHY